MTMEAGVTVSYHSANQGDVLTLSHRRYSLLAPSHSMTLFAFTAIIAGAALGFFV